MADREMITLAIILYAAVLVGLSRLAGEIAGRWWDRRNP